MIAVVVGIVFDSSCAGVNSYRLHIYVRVVVFCRVQVCDLLDEHTLLWDRPPAFFYSFGMGTTFLVGRMSS